MLCRKRKNQFDLYDRFEGGVDMNERCSIRNETFSSLKNLTRNSIYEYIFLWQLQMSLSDLFPKRRTLCDYCTLISTIIANYLSSPKSSFDVRILLFFPYLFHSYYFAAVPYRYSKLHISMVFRTSTRLFSILI